MKIAFRLAVIAVVSMTICAASSFAQSSDSEYVVVANKALPGSAINISALKVVYERGVRTWKNSDSEIIPVDLYTSTRFYQNLFGKSYTQMQMQWVKMRNGYSMNLPVFKKDAESVKEFVAANRDAIGFLKLSDVDDRVKVIKIIN